MCTSPFGEGEGPQRSPDFPAEVTGHAGDVAGEWPGAPGEGAGAQDFNRVQRAELLGRLAGGMAHDLNNCLATIRIYGGLALAGVGEESSIREAIAEIQTAAEHAGMMVRRLLSFGRVPQRQRSVIDLQRALHRAATLLDHALREEVELRADARAGETAVLIDPAELDQLILNLALNASDAMPDGGVLTLSTHLVDLEADEAGRLGVPPGSYAVLRVSDTGSGIDPEKIQRIFEPSFTTKQEDHGVGLGLVRVADVVRESGGAVTVESEPGRGTSFEVFFPSASGQPCDSSEGGRAAWSRGTETILIVEADDSLRCVAARLLELQGYRVIRARSPSEAQMKATAAGSAIDLLLTDVDAQHAARVLNALPAQGGRAMKLLLMPGQADSAARRGVEESSRFLSKPFGGEDLLAAVRRLLDS